MLATLHPRDASSGISKMNDQINTAEVRHTPGIKKKMLHMKKVNFALLYPAKLRIETKDGHKIFFCPQQALVFIEKME